MAELELRKIAHRYGSSKSESYALKPLDLTLRDGGAYALLGPSGCGKTTLLNILSGLVRPSEGTVSIAGRDVTAASPEQRNIAQVFQFPVIYDTMTVFENLAFPLRNRGVDRAAIAPRVAQIAELLELTTALSRRASGLSAEEKQRISLGRGLVRRDVAAILFDEPLTVIDPYAKLVLRRKLLEVRRELNVTMIYVTHDQTEALSLADEVLVMSEGEVLQRGTPRELFERPAHTFVGYFIGSPGMNVLPCAYEQGRATVLGQSIVVREESLRAAREVASQELRLGIRPEFIRVHERTVEAATVAATLTDIEQLGAYRTLKFAIGEQTVLVKSFEEQELPRTGSRCYLELPPEHSILYANGRALP